MRLKLLPASSLGLHSYVRFSSTSRIACITRQTQIIALIGLSVHSFGRAFLWTWLALVEPLIYRLARLSEPDQRCNAAWGV